VEKVLPHTDLFLYDVKHADARAHEKGTGTGNEIILSNLRGISKAKASFIVRTPIVPGFNDDLGALSRIAGLAAELGARELHLLPYHRYGSSKIPPHGKSVPMGTVPDLSREKAEEFAAMRAAKAWHVQIGRLKKNEAAFGPPRFDYPRSQLMNPVSLGRKRRSSGI
jgi:pyruvate formate lyase activating enzyme